MVSIRVLLTRLALALALALSVLVVGNPQPAYAHPLCDTTPDNHWHYHFPYKHNDDWVWSHYRDGRQYWINTDHGFTRSTNLCD